MVKEKIKKYEKPLKIYVLTMSYGIVGAIFMVSDMMHSFDIQNILLSILLVIFASFVALPIYILVASFCMSLSRILKVLSSTVLGFFIGYAFPFFGDITMGQREFCNDSISISEAIFVIQDCPLNSNFFKFFFIVGIITAIFLLIMHACVGFIFFIKKHYNAKKLS